MYVIHYGALSEESSPFTDCVISISVVFLKNFPLCTDIISHLGKRHVFPVVQEYFVSSEYSCIAGVLK
jgi:hypothetical protein